jgi:hypothetical protein
LLAEAGVLTLVKLFVERKTLSWLMQAFNGGFLFNLVQQQVHVLEAAFEVLNELLCATMPASTNYQFCLLKLWVTQLFFGNLTYSFLGFM